MNLCIPFHFISYLLMIASQQQQKQENIENKNMNNKKEIKQTTTIEREREGRKKIRKKNISQEIFI